MRGYCDFCERYYADIHKHTKNCMFRKKVMVGLRQCKEGRTYIWHCSSFHGRCTKSKLKTSVCHDCHVKECKKWYALGKKDARRRA